VPVKRGQCPVCRFRFRLRKDGTLMAHILYSNGQRHACKGAGSPPRPFDPGECPECVGHRFGTPGLGEACASVGIENGRSASVMLREYLTAFHERGHEDPALGSPS
jgi:hypothetical protein